MTVQIIRRFLSEKSGSLQWVHGAHPLVMRSVAVVVGAGLIAGFAGPYGTFHYWPILLRALFWLAIAAGAVAVAGAFRHVLAKRYPNHDHLFADTLTTVFSVPVVALMALGLDRIMPDKSGGEALSYGELLRYGAEIALLVLAARALFLWWASQKHADQQDEALVARLSLRLPEELGNTILKLTANGHFVEVTTTLGTHEIRMRFADAIGEMEPVEGFCAHRSHWVTRAAVADTHVEDGKTWLVMTNGEKVPVSRKFRLKLEQAGII